MDTRKVSRRHFLATCSAVSAGFLGLNLLTSCTPNEIGYGPLLEDPEKILNLPKGFSYKIISRMGTTMSDGLFVPGKADGMATFPGKNGRTIIVRNHEINPDQMDSSPYGKKNELLENIKPEKLYDYGRGVAPALGGTTTIVFDPKQQKVEKEFLSLVGTTRNCAGGPTPWNSWITCEETVQKQDIEANVEKDHGYNFEVPATQEIALADPIPLKDMGRFNHEAIAVHPESSIVYQTEDRNDGLIYRYLPNDKQKLQAGGKLQALAIRGEHQKETRNWKELTTEKFPTGKKFVVEWIDMDNVASPEDDLRHRGFAKGASRFARGEGMWFGNNELYFACTEGGDLHKGQIFRYRPSKFEGQPQEQQLPGTLELFTEPNNIELLQNCDNLTVAPWGDLVICEDCDTPRVVGVTPQGKFYQIAKNIANSSEFAGCCFSPTGETLFVNIQHSGWTLAITGPWKRH